MREETAEVNEEEEPRRESHLGLARRFLGHDGAPSSPQHPESRGA